MNNNKELLLNKIAKFNLSPNSQSLWRTIEASIANQAKVLYDKRINDNHLGSTFMDWWESCCDLLLHRQLVIADVNFDSKSDKGEEYIEIHNQGPLIVDISSLRINAGDKGQDYTFPERTILMPQESLRVFTQADYTYSFESKTPLLNNKGDTVYLYDREGIKITSWAYGGDVNNDIEIGIINYDGKEARTESDEFVEIANAGCHWLDLSSWKLSAGKHQEFIFPHDTHIQPFSAIRVYTNLIDPSTGGYSFNSRRAVWNNNGDIGQLWNTDGTLVSEYSYGNMAEA